MEVVTDFVKNLNLLDLLVILVTVILVLAGILISIVARSRRSMYGLLIVAVAPLLLGLLAMVVKYRLLARGFSMFGRLNDEAIAAGRREALVIACVGATGTVVLVLTRFLGLALKKNAKT